MTVVSVFTGQLRPGQFEHALEMNRTSKKILERHGAEDHRILVPAVSAAAYGSIINLFESDDMAAWGEFYDSIMADEELVSLLHQLQGADSPYVSQSMSVAIEIPLGRNRGAKGNVVTTYMTAPLPGRFQAALTFGSQVFDLLERHGARNCRLWQQQANGVLPDVLVATVEYDTMGAYGKSIKALMEDSGAQSMREQLLTSDTPLRQISNDIYTEIVG